MKQQMQHLASNITENSLAGMYATVALAANSKAKYGYNPKPIRVVNGYRLSNTFDFKDEEIKSYSYVANSINEMIVYPNPAKDNVIIVLPDSYKGCIEITDLTGKIVYRSNISNSTFEISLNTFESGMYFIRNLKNSNSIKLSIIK
jgi:hypothetical protein